MTLPFISILTCILLTSCHAPLPLSPAPSPSPAFTPNANAQSLSTPNEVPLNITLAGTASNSDDTLTYTVVTQPSHGTLSGTAPNLTYTPEETYSGTDSFTFKATEGSTDSDPATISVNVSTDRAVILDIDAGVILPVTEATSTSVTVQLRNDTNGCTLLNVSAFGTSAAWQPGDTGFASGQTQFMYSYWTQSGGQFNLNMPSAFENFSNGSPYVAMNIPTITCSQWVTYLGTLVNPAGNLDISCKSYQLQGSDPQLDGNANSNRYVPINWSTTDYANIPGNCGP